MNCVNCRQPFLACHCEDLDKQIEVFLAGHKVDNRTHNRLVQRAAEVIDVRIRGKEAEFIRRNAHLRLRAYRSRRLWATKKG